MANFNTVDFSKTTPTTAKNKARSAMVDFINETMIETFGAENVSKVGDSEISIAIGDRVDSDGFVREVCVNISPVAKEVEDRAASKNIYEAYDRLAIAEYYEKEKAKKEEEKKKKEDAKKKAQEKLKEAKAKREEEKKRRITEKLANKKDPDEETTDENIPDIEENDE